MVECQLPKLKVAGSNPVSRSNKNRDLGLKPSPFFVAQRGNEYLVSFGYPLPYLLLCISVAPLSALDIMRAGIDSV